MPASIYRGPMAECLLRSAFTMFFAILIAPLSQSVPLRGLQQICYTPGNCVYPSGYLHTAVPEFQQYLQLDGSGSYCLPSAQQCIELCKYVQNKYGSGTCFVQDLPWACGNNNEYVALVHVNIITPVGTAACDPPQDPSDEEDWRELNGARRQDWDPEQRQDSVDWRRRDWSGVQRKDWYGQQRQDGYGKHAQDWDADSRQDQDGWRRQDQDGNQWQDGNDWQKQDWDEEGRQDEDSQQKRDWSGERRQDEDGSQERDWEAERRQDGESWQRRDEEYAGRRLA